VCAAVSPVIDSAMTSPFAFPALTLPIVTRCLIISHYGAEDTPVVQEIVSDKGYWERHATEPPTAE